MCFHSISLARSCSSLPFKSTEISISIHATVQYSQRRSATWNLCWRHISNNYPSAGWCLNLLSLPSTAEYRSPQHTLTTNVKWCDFNSHSDQNSQMTFPYGPYTVYSITCLNRKQRKMPTKKTLIAFIGWHFGVGHSLGLTPSCDRCYTVRRTYSRSFVIPNRI